MGVNLLDQIKVIEKIESHINMNLVKATLTFSHFVHTLTQCLNLTSSFIFLIKQMHKSW
jgi:hypothetical protein